MGETIRLDTIEDAITDLMQGKVIIVVDDEDRENEGDFVALAEKATPEVINFMITEGRGLVCVPITEERAREFDLRRWSCKIQTIMARPLPYRLTISIRRPGSPPMNGRGRSAH